MFLGGLGGIAWELTHPPADPSILIILAGMVGLPIMLYKDRNGK